MPISFLIPAIIGAAGSLFGGLLGRKTQKTEGTYGGQSQTTQQIGQPFGEFQTMLIQNLMNRLQSPVPLAGYEGTGLDVINQARQGAQQRMLSSMASRGLAGSPVAALANENLNAASLGEQSRFLNSLPLLQRQLELEDFSQAMGLYGMAPRTTYQTQSGTQTGSAQVPGSLGAGVGDLGGILGMLAAMGVFGGSSKPKGPYSV